MNDDRNKYANDNDIRWIYAQRINGGEWIIRYLSASEQIKNSIQDSRMIDETPIGIMRESEFGIFSNRAEWWNKKPHRYLDCRDKSKWPIRGLEGLINSRSSSDL